MAHTAFEFTPWVYRSSELWHNLSIRGYLSRGLIFLSNTTTLSFHQLYFCRRLVCYQFNMFVIQRLSLYCDCLRT